MASVYVSLLKGVSATSCRRDLHSLSNIAVKNSISSKHSDNSCWQQYCTCVGTFKRKIAKGGEREAFNLKKKILTISIRTKGMPKKISLKKKNQNRPVPQHSPWYR